METIYRDWQADPWNATVDTVSSMHIQGTHSSGDFADIVAPASANFPDPYSAVSTRYFVDLPMGIDVSDLAGAKPVIIWDNNSSLALTRVAGAPGANEFRVPPATSERNYIIEINATQAGHTLSFDYYALGTILTRYMIPRYDGYGGSGRLELGAELTGDRAAYIDFHSDDTYTNYGMEIVRGAGANGTAQIICRGTGGLVFNTLEAGNIDFYTTNLLKLRIDATSGYLNTYGGTIELGTYNSGDRAAAIDFHSDDTYTDYGLRVAKAGGANAAATFTVRGTGGIEITTQEAAPIVFNTTGLERLRITSDGKFSTGAEAAPDINTGGLCLKLDAGLGSVISLKSTGSDHGITSVLEADTHCRIREEDSDTNWNTSITTCGGQISSFSLYAYLDKTTVDTTTGLTATAVVEIETYKKSGTGGGTLDADENMVTLCNATSAKHIFKGDGDIYTDTSVVGIYDAEDDILLAKVAKNMLGGIKIPDYLAKHKDRLEELSIMKNGFVSHTNMMRLNLGTMDQMFNMIRHLAKKLNISEDELLDYAKQY